VTLVISQAQNETNVVFVPRTIQILDEAMSLGEIVISGQHATSQATDATSKTQTQNAAGRASGTSAHFDEQFLTSGQGDVHNSSSLDEVDMKSWNVMTSQKRSKVGPRAWCRRTFCVLNFLQAIETLLRRQLGEWKPPALAKKGGGSSVTKCACFIILLRSE
jgi:hypothetical protein